jgi:hypothetical protein
MYRGFAGFFFYFLLKPAISALKRLRIRAVPTPQISLMIELVVKTFPIFLKKSVMRVNSIGVKCISISSR